MIENIQGWSESAVENEAHGILNSLKTELNKEEKYGKESLEKIKEKISGFIEKKIGRKQKIKEILIDLLNKMESFSGLFDGKLKPINNTIESHILNSIPKFIYYSEYGNLDSEIYLPHVIQNFERTDLGEKERAKARTLKVLFDFVDLSPTEILELGQETNNRRYDNNGRLIQDQAFNQKIVAEESEKKKKREVLLQSASTRLTIEFRKWWEQGITFSGLMLMVIILKYGLVIILGRKKWS